MASIMALRVSSSTGYSCSARSYLREIGRKIWVATWRAWLAPTWSRLGSSRLIMVSGPWLGEWRGWWVGRRSQDHHALCHSHCAEVSVPALDGVLLGEAVTTAQLHAVQADLHALLGGELAGQGGLAGERQALLGAGGTTPGHQAHAVELGGDVCHHERHGLAVGDGLTERVTLLDIGGHVVQDRVRGADGQGRPAEAGQS